jgi:C4-dicarboxylate-specific signal transduction histidine kinase
MHSEIVVRKVRVDLHLEESLPPALAERVGVQQVLINLILNSLDALQSHPPPDRAVNIATSTKEGFIMITVHDTGPGIPADMMPRLFEAFASTKPNGLGLGLTISQRIVAQFGGELLAENHPDGGAVFRMSLPIADRSK